MNESRSRRALRHVDAGGATLARPIQGKLPRGASSLPKHVVEAEQRKRLTLATAKVVAAKGFADASVADIIGVAGVSRATFYELFKDKEDCFLFGFRKLSCAHLQQIQVGMQVDGGLSERLYGAIRAYIERIDADGELAQAFIAEAESATPAIRAEFVKAMRDLRRTLNAWLDEVQTRYPTIARPAEVDVSLTMSGLIGHVIDRVRLGRRFTAQDVAAIHAFLLRGLGLHESLSTEVAESD